MFKRLSWKSLASIILTGVVATLFFGWAFQIVEIQPARLATKSEESPTWYWEVAHYRAFDEQGALVQDATADGVIYYEIPDTAYMAEPRIKIFGDDGLPWHTDSRFGSIIEDGARIELWQDVVIHKASEDLSVKTQRLVIFPDQNMAETDSPVTLLSVSSRTDAVGMRAWLEQEKIELLSEVKTIHDPREQ